MALFFVSIALGLLIVAVAVGYPYWRTHHRMRDPYDKAEARGYFAAKEQADEGVLPDQPDRPAQQVPVATQPVGIPQPAGPDLAGPDLAGPELAGPELAGPDLAGPGAGRASAAGDGSG
jgi:hypothetical protein